MRAFVAGGAGVPGRRLVARDHEVTATTKRAARPLPEQLGAEGFGEDPW
ncbi:hypothetical protein AB0J86_31145 [Micromonospora sp. NPDC049559]